jgi:hypothetical protein
MHEHVPACYLEYLIRLPEMQIAEGQVDPPYPDKEALISVR